jgi:membrane-associated phospholipid phosphatase
MHDLRSKSQNLINSLRQQGVWLIGYLLILSIVAWLCTEVWEKEAFSFDRSLLLWIHQFANPQLDGLMLFITALGDPGTVITVFISTIVWLGMKRRYTDAIGFLIICTGGVLINQVMKLFFAKPRPELWTRLISETSFSFPSGHAVGSMVVYGFIGYILAREFPVYQRYIYAAASILIIAVGFSRLYLGVHYPTDIIAGYGVGILWLITCLKVKFSRPHSEDNNIG